jgi:cytochrome P450
VTALPTLSELAARRIADDGGEHERVDGLPPGPTANSWLQLFGFLFRPIPFLEACREQYGDRLTLRLPATPPIVQFSDPSAVKEVFAASGDAMHAGKANEVLSAFLGRHSVLVLDGVRHRAQRRLLLPPFRGERMRAYGNAMRDITEARIARWRMGHTFRMQTETQAITLDVILRTVFGMEEGAAMDSMREKLVQATRILDNPVFLIKAFQRDLGPRSPWGRFLRLRQAAYEETLELLALRRREGYEDRDDILSMLLSATYEDGSPMTDEEIYDELLTLLVAGHETTATALSWTIHRLTRHPAVLERVQREIDDVYPEGEIDPDRSAELHYLDAVIKESLRIHPVIPGVGRVLMEPETVGGEALPPGVVVGCSIYLAHFNPDVWPDPHRFDPDRFLGKRPSPNTYFPFGGGIRRCIGEAFALYEMRIVLATILRQLVPEPAPFRRIGTMRRNITLTPSAGLPVRFRRR